ncbi:MAG: hypothetical protein RAP03_00425, partial [Candidatus Electryonea clarkiae]|nr:hypothetical protein [Candidatus Electryonea clarkiae]
TGGGAPDDTTGGGEDEFAFSRDSERLFTIMGQMLNEDQINLIRQHLLGYNLSEIIIDGEEQRSLAQLIEFLSIPGFTFAGIETQ